jgi:type IV pilus assembly protein PilQ
MPPNSNSNIPALNFKDTDIRDVLRSVAMEFETNIVTDNSINNKISVSLFNIDVFNAVKIIATDNGFEFSYDSQRFFVKLKNKIVPPPPPEKEPIINFTDNKLSITLEDVEISKVIEKIREKTHRNFLLTSGTSGRVTGTLTNVELETGLRNILTNNGFYLTQKDSIYYVTRSAYFSSLDEKNEQKSKSAYWVSGFNNRATIDVVSGNLGHIISDLANQLNLQIIKLAEPNANVTVRCKDVPIKTALNYLFKGTEFSYKEVNNTFIIGGKDSKSVDNSRLVRLNYLRADKLKEKIPATLLQTVNINVSMEHNALILTGNNDIISNIEDYVHEIDQPVAQVVIEALVVDYNLDNILQYGISMGTGDSATLSRKDQWYPGLDVTASGKKINNILNSLGKLNLFGKEIDFAKLGKLPDNFYANIKALESVGIANVKSKPILSAINGATASLKIGTTQNYILNNIMPVTSAVNSTFLQQESIQKIEANISFEITPWIGSNSELTLEIKPDFETPIGQFSPDKNLIPAINKRSLVSTIRLKDGETVVLGGLIQESETNTQSKVPLLGDIPFIGSLFTSVDKKKSKGQLMIYITPKINYGDDFGSLYFNYSK